MQSGPGARPEWNGKHLFAVKRLKERFPNWDVCRELPELVYLRSAPCHQNVVALWDSFFDPSARELFMVFECSEGNLYHLIKSRKGRPLAKGLVGSITYQGLSGLQHIHTTGCIHRDIKPENLLVTTTGLRDYPAVDTTSSETEHDVTVIIKIADFGSVRNGAQEGPLTDYIAMRWYRAPELILRTQRYTTAIDVWAIGVVMSELTSLRPLFPSSEEVDHMNRVCELLGDPGTDYGVDESGVAVGGGQWPTGLQLASDVGVTFPRVIKMYQFGSLTTYLTDYMLDASFISFVSSRATRYWCNAVTAVTNPEVGP